MRSVRLFQHALMPPILNARAIIDGQSGIKNLTEEVVAIGYSLQQNSACKARWDLSASLGAPAKFLKGFWRRRHFTSM